MTHSLLGPSFIYTFPHSIQFLNNIIKGLAFYQYIQRELQRHSVHFILTQDFFIHQKIGGSITGLWIFWRISSVWSVIAVSSAIPPLALGQQNRRATLTNCCASLLSTYSLQCFCTIGSYTVPGSILVNSVLTYVKTYDSYWSLR